jgi:hypothetical protein
MSTPPWQRLAESGYALLLHLYPRRTRERHGEEMRQAFRDRCREARDGRISAWRLLGAELAPDLATSLASAHLEEPFMPRIRIAIVGFALLACAWFFQDAISKRFLDVYFTARLHYQHWHDERAFAHDEARVRALAGQLAANPDATQRALAAYLYATNAANRRFEESYVIGTPERLAFEPLPRDAGEASWLLASLSSARSAQAARINLETCRLVQGCRPETYATRLVQLEPSNAYGWSQLFKLHSSAGNEAAALADLGNLARSSHYEDGMKSAVHSIWLAANQFADGNAEVFGALGRQLLGPSAGYTDEAYENDVMFRCSLGRPNTTRPPRWLRHNLAARPECKAAAQLLADSSDPWASRWGWNWLNRAEPSARTAAGAQAAEIRLRKVGTFGGTITDVKSHGWRPWTDAEWMAWATAKPRPD